MLKCTLFTAMLTCTLLSGCQSTRFAPTFPRANEYGVVLSQQSNKQQYTVAAVTGPVMSAALPGPDVAAGTSPQPRMPLLIVSKSLPVQTSPRLAAPDTTLNRLLQPPSKLPADPLTTVVNAVGAAAALGGAGLAIAGASNNSSGYYPLVQIITGFALLAVGIPLLFFQGKNGRRRLIREDRKRNAVAGDVPVPKTDAANKPLQKLGLGMGIAAGIVLLLGALFGTISFALASFIGVPLGIVGLVLFIAGS